MRIKAFLLALFWSASALAQQIEITIDLSDQQMTVVRAGDALHVWPVSTARPGKCTPTGVFHPQFLDADHRSSLYGGAPMPWSIFFHGNYAIHGTTEVERLGQPASAGCVRLDPENARLLYSYVCALPFSETRIEIVE